MSRSSDPESGAPESPTQSAPGRGRGSPAGPPTFAPDTVLAGRFRIVRFIAQGGMGEVYEARDLELDEEVALKTVRPDIAGDARAAERFRTEIQIARKVTHPNACRIFDVFHHRTTGESGDTLFLAMELLRGETLAERLRRGRFPVAEALPLVRQMAEALGAAHHVGVIHRDFKSGNVMLVPEARPAGSLRAVVTDFGLARRASVGEASTVSLTLSEHVVGTPAYMAPEQVEGAPLTPAADIYALGVVMYEMLTGQRPFGGDTPVAAMVKRLREAPPSPRRLVSDLDPLWEAVILRCLERDPADRFESAEQVVAALRGEEVSASRASRVRRRRRLRRAALAAAAVLALGLLGFWASERLAWRSPAPQSGETALAPSGPSRARPSVAVLGFKNLTGRAETAWLSTALSEMLGSELAAGEALRIVPGESVARAKVELALAEGDSLAADTLGRVRSLLGADVLVLGSYTVLGGRGDARLRLDLRLQDAAGGTSVSFAETGTESELFELVSRSGARLRERLGTAPRSEEQAREVRASLPANPEAARLYAEGLGRLRLFDALAARELLQKAVAADPAHPLTHSALAAAWTMLGYEGRAREEAKKAVDLSAPLSREDRLFVEARYRETTMEWDEAVEIYRSLVHFFPDDLEYGLRLASALVSAGKGKEALATFEALRQLPPPAGRDPRIDLSEALALRLLSESERAVEAASRAAAEASRTGARHLLARARFEEGSSLQNLGEVDRAQAALEEARRMFAQSGDKKGTAGALNNIALMVSNRGDLAGAKGLSEEALALYRAIGNKSGEALMESNIGNILYFQGDLSGARKRWEKTLVTYRELNEKDGVARMLTNIASVVAEQGVLSEARDQFEEALAAWREIGNKSGAASTQGNLAKVLYQEGDLARADIAYRECLDLFRGIGDKTYAAYALHDYGELLLNKGDFAGARRRFEEALAMRQATGEKTTAALTRLALAELTLEEGRAAEAEAAAREAALFLKKEKSVDGQVTARLVLARSLLAQRRPKEAREAAGEATTLAAQSESRSLRALAAVVEARVRATTGAAEDVVAARSTLRALLREKARTTPLAVLFEARLALAEISVRADPAAARRELRSLEAEARDKGFALVAGKAAAALSRG